MTETYGVDADPATGNLSGGWGPSGMDVDYNYRNDWKYKYNAKLSNTPARWQDRYLLRSSGNPWAACVQTGKRADAQRKREARLQWAEGAQVREALWRQVGGKRPLTKAQIQQKLINSAKLLSNKKYKKRAKRTRRTRKKKK